MQRSRAVALALSTAALIGAALAPSAGAVSRGGLQNERYCEVIALRGELPEVTATIYNTIGFNECPAPWWDSLDPQQVAEDQNAFAVLLNGPRYWTIDRATSDGIDGVTEVEGELLGQVAQIVLRSQEEMQSQPYTERTILRDNQWRWRANRRVYELLADDGDVYMMQSYSQIVDPEQRRRDLVSLGERLDLPKGWSFQTRKLKRPYVLDSAGEATIIQDDLQNTYQRVPGERPPRSDRRGGKSYPTTFTKFKYEVSNGKAKFEGKIDSSKGNCVPDRKVKLFRKKSGDTKKLGDDSTSGKGKFSIGLGDAPPKDGKYYAEVKEATVGDNDNTCLSKTSPTLKLS
jgi:hypothetical protein